MIEGTPLDEERLEMHTGCVISVSTSSWKTHIKTAALGQAHGAASIPLLMLNSTAIQWKSSSRLRVPQDLKTNVWPNEHIITAGSAC